MSPQTGAGDKTGSSWTNATADLQAAINASPPAGQVWVAVGTYKPTTGTDRTVSFAMKADVSIYGGFVGTETALSERPNVDPVAGNGARPSSTTLSGDIGVVGDKSDNSNHVIVNAVGLSRTAILDGFVITEGGGSGGGAIYNAALTGICSPTIRNCAFVNNSDGAISNYAAQPGNTTLVAFSNPLITNCLFQGNVGGAISSYVFQGDSYPLITYCVFQGNSADEGGAIFSSANYGTCNPVIGNCVFEGNSADGGGAIASNAGQGVCSPVLTNCAFLNNTARRFGGAYYNTCVGGTSSTVMTNCSFQGNSSPIRGSLIYVDNRGNDIAMTLNNCVLFGNGGDKALFNYFGTDKIRVNSSLLEPGLTDYVGTDNLTTTTSPFVSDATVALNACSPAINAGNPNRYTAVGGPPTDVVGNPRVVGPAIDMGALEFQNTPSQPLAITAQPVASSSVCAGTPVRASVSVSGTITAYQWYKDGSPLSGQNAATITLATTTTASSGRYSVVITGACNSVTSTAFSLTVNPAPSVSISPSSTAVCAGSVATLTASAGDAGATFAYRWSTGATTATISVSATTSTTYAVTAVTSSGCPATATARLTVNPRPATPYLTPVPRTLYTTSFAIPLLLYALPTNFGLDLRFYDAATNVRLDPAVIRPTRPGTFDYYATQTNNQGCVSVLAPFSLKVLEGGTLVSPPANRSVCAGTSTVLSVTATGGNLQYSWYEVRPDTPLQVNEVGSNTKNGKTANLTVNNVQQSKLYYCLVIGDKGIGVAGPIRVSVRTDCGAGARLSAGEDDSSLRVTVLGNPVQGEQVELEVRGAEGQPLRLQLSNSAGQAVSERVVEQAGAVERQTLSLGSQGAGVLLLRVSTPTQSQTVKLLKP